MSRPPRYAGCSYIGLYQYFLTFCTRDRIEVFRHATVVEQTVLQFRRTAVLEHFAILVYCVMPDHVHLLVEGTTDDADLRTFVKLAKQRSGGTYARRVHRPLWQEGYYDRVIRPEDDIRRIARYILENPVRARLVVEPVDYPYSGSDVWRIEDLLEVTSL